jgi:elongation factor Ts
LEDKTAIIKELRELCGAGVMDCRNALINCDWNIQKAAETLKEQGYEKAAKKADRATGQGLIEAYIHAGGRVGAIVELNCETDFVARTDEFKNLAHDIAMQITAMSPCYICKEELPEDAEEPAEVVCLMEQPFIKDQGRTVRDLIIETIAKTRENIRISRFTRFELGETQQD